VTASDLLDDLLAAGLSVETLPDWETRGGSWATGSPVGVMEHHTAPPVPFPVDKLVGSQLKANINTKPDGTVWILAYRACNYSSGTGSGVVLDETQRGTPPPANAADRGLDDDTNGNPWYFNFENDHPGDGSPIPAVQLDAIAVATRVVLDHFGLADGSVVSHAEWTARKSDPYWNGDRRCIEEIRRRVEEDIVITDADADKIAAKTVARLMAEGIWQTSEGGVPIPFEKIVSRDYRNLTETVNALRDLAPAAFTVEEVDE
jgi:hypothetical protein